MSEQIVKQVNRQHDRQMDGRADRWAGIRHRAGEWLDCIGGQIGRRMDGWIGRWMDGHGHAGGWTGTVAWADERAWSRG